MKHFIFCTILVSLSIFSFGQQQNTQYHRVKINLLHTELSQVAKLGLEVDHGEFAKGRHLINDFSEREIQLLVANGIDFDILIRDVQKHYCTQNTHTHTPTVELRNPSPCDADDTGTTYDYTTPSNYSYGSMGGYHTLDELYAVLDSMHLLYPELISVKTPIEGALTHEDRPIYWLRVSNNPTVDEDKPEVLFTALHHAREPNSLSQMIFHLWYLLENYDSDPEVKYLVDNTEQYFIPCVNPDGYVHNEITNPEGGGLWRKNRRADSTGNIYGVDLNRNYGYEWGIDDFGSSPNIESDVYRGPAGFSEPETQAVRDFCNTHQFQICLNYHTHGNLLIYPWGYNDTPTDESPSFLAFAQLMTAENDFLVGTPTETVGYTVNGVSDDWMYGETETKPRIFSMTPEVGPNNYGFWPPQSAIDELNKSTILQNLVTAHLVLNYGEVEDAQASTLFAESGALDFNFKKFGLQEGPITVTFASATDEMTISTPPQVFDFTHLEEGLVNVEYQINSEIPIDVVFEATIDNGLHQWTQSFTKKYFPDSFEPIFVEDGTSEDVWSLTSSWASTTEDFVSAPSSWTDSPNGNYPANATNILRKESSIDLTYATSALAKFYAKWDIESNFDYAQFMVSKDGVLFEPQCGRYTRIGNNNQDENQPLYDGEQSDWVLEEIDLSAYLGEKIYIQFRIVSDGFVSGDGFYFDDMVVEAVLDEDSAAPSLDLTQHFLVYPNPVNDWMHIDCMLQKPSTSLELSVFNTLGQVVFQQKRTNLSQTRHQWQLPTKNWEAGLYIVQLKNAEGQQTHQLVTK